MSGGENVIFLQFRSPHMVEDERAFIACKNCRNKTYLLIEDKPGTFPLMQCAACGQHMGRMGWWHDDEPDEPKSA